MPEQESGIIALAACIKGSLNISIETLVPFVSTIYQFNWSNRIGDTALDIGFNVQYNMLLKLLYHTSTDVCM